LIIPLAWTRADWVLEFTGRDFPMKAGIARVRCGGCAMPRARF
jgi:hypothetical protein